MQFSHQSYKPEQISSLIGISVATVYKLHKRYQQEGLQWAIDEKARPGQPRKVTAQLEAEITAIACSEAPDGSVRWTVGVINERLIKLEIHTHDESVHLALTERS